MANLRKSTKIGNVDQKSKKQYWAKIKIRLKNDWQIYILLLPAVLYMLIIKYIPIYGIQIAFKDYRFVDGITGSKWIGLENFKTFFNSYYAKRLILNTFSLNFNGLLVGFLPPIILAILLTKIGNAKIKRFIQTVIYVPNFISVVVLAGMLYCFLSPVNGMINMALQSIGIAPIDFLGRNEWFQPVYHISGIWQGAGFSSILYIAYLSSVDPTLYEAADIDGASVMQKIWHIDIPSLKSIVVMQLIMSFGRMMSSNTDKVLLLQNDTNIAASDIIGTYVYAVGLEGAKFSYSTAIGLFSTVINFILLVSMNWFSKKVSGTGMF